MQDAHSPEKGRDMHIHFIDKLAVNCKSDNYSNDFIACLPKATFYLHHMHKYFEDKLRLYIVKVITEKQKVMI